MSTIITNNIIDKPPTEQQLFILQLIYLTAKEEEAWTSMFTIIRNYARSLALKLNTGKVFLSPEIIDDKSTLAATKFMERYVTDPTFKVDASFAGILKWKVIEAMYGDHDEDYHISMNAILDSTKKEFSESQLLSKFEPLSGAAQTCSPEEISLQTDVFEELSRILDEFDEEMHYDNRICMLARCYLMIELSGPKSRHAKELFKKHFIKDPREGVALDTILLEIRDHFRELRFA